jgi:hypothetical protein
VNEVFAKTSGGCGRGEKCFCRFLKITSFASSRANIRHPPHKGHPQKYVPPSLQPGKLAVS